MLEFKKRSKRLESGAKIYQYGAIFSILAAAGIGGYGVYNAQRTVPVLVAAHTIQPYTFITSKDFKVVNIKVSDVFPDTIHGFDQSEMSGKMTNIGVLQGDQIRLSMLNSNSSLQDMVTSGDTASDVIVGLTYKTGTLDAFVPSGAYVNLSVQGQNNTMNEVDGIKVLQNTGYIPTPTTAQPSSGNNNQNAPSPMLILEIPKDKYSSIGASIANSQVQVLMINQNNISTGSSTSNTGAASSTGNNSSGNTNTQGTPSAGLGSAGASPTGGIQAGSGSLGTSTGSGSQTVTTVVGSQKGGKNSVHK